MHYLTGGILTLACMLEKSFTSCLNDFNIVYYLKICFLQTQKPNVALKYKQTIIFTDNSHVYSQM